MASVKKTAGFLDQGKINKIVDLMRSGHSGKVSFPPLSGLPTLDKIVLENSAPSDNPAAIGYVTNQGDDIHLVLPNLEKAISEQMSKSGLDPSELNSMDFANLDNNPKFNTIIIVLQSALQLFAHELGHLEGTKSGGELKSEPYAEQKGAEAMKSLKVSHSTVKSELQKLASKLSDLGEDSFVADVMLIEGMLPAEETAKTAKKLSSRDLSILTADLDRLFTK